MSAQLLINSVVAHAAIEAILFDKDGTLIDIHYYWASMIRIRAALIVKRCFNDQVKKDEIEAELIDSMGVDLQSGRMKPEGPVGVEPRHCIVNVAANVVRRNGCDISNHEMEAIFSEVDYVTSSNLLPLLKLLPGVEDLLKMLKDACIPAFIVSTDITSRACKAMETLQLDRYFEDIIGGDQVENSKPSADMALLALKRCGVTPKGAVVIGDHPVDIKMGCAANVGLNIGVLTGLSEHSAFDGLACHIVSDLSAIAVREKCE